MPKICVVVMVCSAVFLALFDTASALQCSGRVVSIGNSKWEVKETCGEPTNIEDTSDVIFQPFYDEIRHTYVHVPVYVAKSIWTYNFGPTALIYILTFQEDKLRKIETGGYGR